MKQFWIKITEYVKSFTHKHPRITVGIAVALVLLIILMIMPRSMMPEPVTAQTPSPTPTATPFQTATPQLVIESTHTPTPTPEPPEMLTHLKPLYEQNNDLAGWLKIDDTEVDYPVMYTPEDGEFYLYRTFEKEDDPTNQGMLFIDKYCTVEPRGTNLLIHGHNMKNGTMFRTLIEYKNENFYKKHPMFQYSTLYETSEYEIVSVFLSKVYNAEDDVFKFYKFYNAATPEEFDEYILNIKKLQLYDTGVTAQYGDLLVTLSTCEYSVTDGRLVVVGRRINEEG